MTEEEYSSKLLGVAMSLFLRSGRSGYEQFKEDSIYVRSCFRDGKRLVLEDTSIHSKFVSLCQSPSMAFQQDTIGRYQIILPKMINSRFSVVFRKWKEAHCQKHEMSLRSSLKAGVSSSKSLPLKRAATQHTDESTNEIKKAKSSE